MAAEVEQYDRVLTRNKQAWHGLATVIEEGLSAEDAGERVGFFWPVDQWLLEAIGPQGQRVTIADYVANIRTRDCYGNEIAYPLSVVTNDYSVCQNRELAQWTDALAQTGKVVIESLGSIRNGKRVWFLARGEQFAIGGDKAWSYVCVSNGHDSTQAIRVTPTSVWVVCSNTLHQVIPREGDRMSRPESAAIVIRHTGKIKDKLEQARRAMKYYDQTLSRNRELFEALHAKEIGEAKTMELFADTYSAYWRVATPEDLRSPDKAVRDTAQNRVERMEKASRLFMARWNRERRELRESGASAWRAFNAMSGFLQHDQTARGKDDAARVERRIESNMFGLNATRTHEVLAAAMALAG